MAIDNSDLFVVYDVSDNENKSIAFGALSSELQSKIGHWTRSGTNLYPSNLGDNVGIGTDNPQSNLHVQGDDATIRINDGRSTNPLTISQLNTAAEIINSGNGGLTFGLANSGSIKFVNQTNKTTRMIIADNGNVGIGKDNPAVKLDINGKARSNSTVASDNGKTLVTKDYLTSEIDALEDVYVNIDGDTMTGDLTVPSLNGGPLAGFRNLIINGDMEIDQRYNGTLTNVGSTSKYVLDHWRGLGGNDGGNNSMRLGRVQSTPVGTTLRHSMQIDHVNGATYTGNLGCIQGIENNFVAGHDYTLSFYCTEAPTNVEVYYSNATLGGSPRVVQFTGAPTDLSGADDANGYRHYKVTFTTVSQNSVGNIGAVEFKWQGGSPRYLTGVQLEPGLVATPFEHRPIELALCHRYYQTSGIQPWSATTSNIPTEGMHTFIPASSADEYSFLFPVELAKLTSLSIKSTAHVANQARRTGGAVSNANITLVGNKMTRKGFSFTTDKTETRTYAFAWEAIGEL